MHHGTCVTPGSFPLKSAKGKDFPGISGACATRNFTFLVRGPWSEVQYSYGSRRPLEPIRVCSHFLILSSPYQFTRNKIPQICINCPFSWIRHGVAPALGWMLTKFNFDYTVIMDLRYNTVLCITSHCNDKTDFGHSKHFLWTPGRNGPNHQSQYVPIMFSSDKITNKSLLASCFYYHYM